MKNEHKELNVNTKDIYALKLATNLLLGNLSLLNKYNINKYEVLFLANQLENFNFENRTLRLLTFDTDIINKIANTVLYNYFEEKDNSFLVKSFENYKKECIRKNEEYEDSLICEVVASLFKLVEKSNWKYEKWTYL